MFFNFISCPIIVQFILINNFKCEKIDDFGFTENTDKYNELKNTILYRNKINLYEEPINNYNNLIKEKIQKTLNVDDEKKKLLSDEELANNANHLLQDLASFHKTSN
jgi:hypothetical protein